MIAISTTSKISGASVAENKRVCRFGTPPADESTVDNVSSFWFRHDKISWTSLRNPSSNKRSVSSNTKVWRFPFWRADRKGASLYFSGPLDGTWTLVVALMGQGKEFKTKRVVRRRILRSNNLVERFSLPTYRWSFKRPGVATRIVGRFLWKASISSFFEDPP